MRVVLALLFTGENVIRSGPITVLGNIRLRLDYIDYIVNIIFKLCCSPSLQEGVKVLIFIRNANDKTIESF